MKKIILSLLVGVLGSAALTVSAEEAELVASPSRITVTSMVSGEAIKVGSEQKVTWSTESFPNGAMVDISLIQKVSDDPLEYELVREIAKNSLNDGEETWKVERTDAGKNLYIQIGCSSESLFANGCEGDLNDNTFAVKNSFGGSLANVLEAFINLFRPNR